MILAIDVGNTNIVMGGIQDGQQVFSARCASDRNKTEDEYALVIQGILAMHGVKPEEIEGGILSSVCLTCVPSCPAPSACSPARKSWWWALASKRD